MRVIYQNMIVGLRRAGIDNPGLEARVILKHVLKVSDSDLIAGMDRAVSEGETKLIHSFLNRRINREPLSRILGVREFHGLSFEVTPDVLDPRPDTETLVEAALNSFGTNPPRMILDLGTGSGCILISLLHEWKESTGVGVDISQAALAVAGRNAQLNNVADRIEFVCDDWGLSLNQSFDLIVSNPPYVASGEISNLDPEVKNHDPILALAGGIDGLDAYRSIITATKRLLNPGGKLFFEVGVFQAADVVRLAEKSGLLSSRTHADLAGILRVVEISSGEK